MKKDLFNNKLLKTRRSSLRKASTPAEKLLWERLRNRKFFGYKFHRQHSVGGYILDFYCSELKLAIEIDGKQHLNNQIRKYDKQRTLNLNTLGIRVIRFTNKEVLDDLDKILKNLGEQL